MNKIFCIALMQLLRMRKNYLIWLWVIVSGFILVLMDLFHYFTIEDQTKMILDFALGLMNLSSLLLAIFYPLMLIKEEFATKTIHTMLSKKVSRLDVVLGIALSVITIIGILLALNTLVLIFLLKLKQIDVPLITYVSVYFIFIKNIILVSYALLLGLTPLSMPIGITIVILVYIIGSIKAYFLLHQHEEHVFSLTDTLKEFFLAVFPDFRIYDLTEVITLKQFLPLKQVGLCSLHSFSISIVILMLAYYLLQRKEI